MEADSLINRMRRFGLLDRALEQRGVEVGELWSTPTFLLNHTHLTTRLLATFVHNHWQQGNAGGIDFLDLWQRLDAQGRDEMISYLREVVG